MQEPVMGLQNLLHVYLTGIDEQLHPALQVTPLPPAFGPDPQSGMSPPMTAARSEAFSALAPTTTTHASIAQSFIPSLVTRRAM
jgi:hypothetical protein